MACHHTATAGYVAVAPSQPSRRRASLRNSRAAVTTTEVNAKKKERRKGAARAALHRHAAGAGDVNITPESSSATSAAATTTSPLPSPTMQPPLSAANQGESESEPPHARELAVAVDAVAIGCRLIARQARPGREEGEEETSSASISVSYKDDATPVTVADYGCQALVAQRIAAAYPEGMRLVAEEDMSAIANSSALSSAVAEAVRAAGGDDGDLPMLAPPPDSSPSSSSSSSSSREPPPSSSGEDGYFVLDPIAVSYTHLTLPTILLV